MKDFKQKKALKKAQEYGEKASPQDIDNVSENMDKMKKGPLVKVWDKVTQLWNAFNNPKVPGKYKAIIIGSLIYMISPIDIIPDTVPGAGLIDDAFVIASVFACVKQIIEKLNYVVETIKQPVLDEYIGKTIDKKLNDMFKKSILYTIIGFCIIIIGLLLVIFKPINQTVSYYAASVLFVGNLVWSWIRFGRAVPLWFPYAKDVITEKSLKKGIAKQVCTQYKAMNVYDNFTKYLQKVLPAVQDLTLENLIQYYIHYFYKKLLIFVLALALYSVLICFILKPLLIYQFGGLNMWQLYFYPIVHMFKIKAY